MRLRIHPLRARNHGYAPAAFIGAEAERDLNVSDLTDRYAGIVVAAFDPKQIGVVPYMPMGGPVLALAVENNGRAFCIFIGPMAGVAGLTDLSAIGIPAHECSGKCLSGRRGKLPRSREEIGGVHSVVSDRAPEDFCRVILCVGFALHFGSV